jgi:hypothetical protein
LLKAGKSFIIFIGGKEGFSFSEVSSSIVRIKINDLAIGTSSLIVTP